MRRFNVRFAAALLVALVALSAATAGLHVVQRGRIAADILWHARAAHDEAKHAEAKLFASQYLAFQPDDLAFMRELLGWYAESKAAPRAILSLCERILQIEPDDESARRQAADAAFTLRKRSVAVDHLQALLKLRPDDGTLLAKLADCQYLDAKYGEAEQLYRRALAAEPTRAASAASYAQLLQVQFKRPDDARAVLDALVLANPANADSYLARARFRKSMGKLADAVADAREALTRKPDDLDCLLFAADLEEATGQHVAARADLEKALALAPTDARAIYHLSWFLIAEGRSDEAAVKLRDGLKAPVNAKNPRLLTLLADVLAGEGQIAPLEDVLKELQGIAGNAVVGTARDQADYVQARLAMRRGDWSQAAALLDRLRTTTLAMPSLNKQCNFLLAGCHERLRDSEGELSAYHRIFELDAAAYPYRLEYAKALARAGQRERALGEYRMAAGRRETNPRAMAEATRTLAHICQGDAKAMRDLERTVDSLKIESGPIGWTLARLELDRTRQRFADALALADRQATKNERNSALQVTRAGLAAAVGGFERGAQAVAEAERAIGDTPELRSLRIRLLATRMGPAVNDALGAIGQRLDRFGPDDRAMILSELAAAYEQVGDASGANRTLERLRQTNADHLGCREALAHRRLRALDDAGWTTLLAEIALIEGAKGWSGRLLTAQRALFKNDAATAGPLVESVLRDRPRDPVALFLRGRLAEMAGREGEARDHYRRAVENRLLDEPAVDELAANLPAGRCRIAVEESGLVDALNYEQHRTLARTLAGLVPAERRGPFAAKLLARDTAGDASQSVWLGQLLMALGQPGSAEEAFTRATRTAPASDDGWVALVNFYAGRNDAAKLRDTLAQAQKSVPAAAAPVVLGRCLDALRQPAEALKQYQAALEREPDNVRLLRLVAAAQFSAGQTSEGRLTLGRIMAPATKAPAEDARWARRTLAVQLSEMPSKSAFERSLALLNANTQPTPEDVRARAVVLAAQKGRAFGDHTCRQEAIRLMEPLAAKIPALADDLLLYARLLAAENDPRITATLGRLAGECGDHYPAVAFRAREAIRAGDLTAAAVATKQLDALGADRLETLVTKFQLLTLAGEADKGRRVLADAVGAIESPAARTRRGVMVARQIDDFLQSNPLADRPEAATALRELAVRLYRDAMAADAGALIRAVTLLCRNGKTPAALDALQMVGKQFPPEVQAAARVAILRNGKPTAQQANATEAYIREALQANPQSLALMVHLADLYDQRGNHERAKELYREVLDRDPDNAVARNNLAWILSYDKTKIDESLAHIQRAIDSHGPLDELLDTRAKILFDSGRHEDGLRDLLEAVHESPSAARYLYLAAMQRRAGRAELAERSLERAKRLGVGPADLHPLDAEALQLLMPR